MAAQRQRQVLALSHDAADAVFRALRDPEKTRGTAAAGTIRTTPRHRTALPRGSASAELRPGAPEKRWCGAKYLSMLPSDSWEAATSPTRTGRSASARFPRGSDSRARAGSGGRLQRHGCNEADDGARNITHAPVSIVSRHRYAPPQSRRKVPQYRLRGRMELERWVQPAAAAGGSDRREHRRNIHDAELSPVQVPLDADPVVQRLREQNGCPHWPLTSITTSKHIIVHGEKNIRIHGK